MAIYNLRAESRLYIVANGLRYLLDVYPDLTFSQTFNETTVPVKTLHTQSNMFEAAVITRANPANFSFTIPLLAESDLDIVLNLLTNYNTSSTEVTLNTADLYIVTNSEVFKLEKAVVEAGTFHIAKDAVLSLAISGSARKLSKFTDVLPGVLQTRSAASTYRTISAMAVIIGGVTQPSITSVSMELKNSVKWTDFATLQNSLAISDASGTMFPEAFVVSSRTLNGTIQQYITDSSNTGLNSWSLNSSIVVQLGSPAFLTFNLPQVVFTNRVEVQDIYIQSYDFRMTSNPGSLVNTIIKA